MDLFCFGPNVYNDPKLPIMCCYIARYYVKITGHETYIPTKMGVGPKQNRFILKIIFYCYLALNLFSFGVIFNQLHILQLFEMSDNFELLKRLGRFKV